MAFAAVHSLFLLTTFLTASAFDFQEATILDIQSAFANNNLTSRQLVQHYLAQIRLFNPHLHAVIELNPDALSDASRADAERKDNNTSSQNLLHGIPILLKDNIATRSPLNTTAGSFALLGSVTSHDAAVVQRLRRAGAIILGKASMSEWANFRSIKSPDGWSPRGGQGRNPYTAAQGPCGSSSGSAIAVAANLVTVSLGTETDGSIICPAAMNSVVGIKPSVGLTSRAGLVPISMRWDTVGPIGRTVADAVAVLDVIVGFDPQDAMATSAAARFIPSDGFGRFLKLDGLKGKRVGILDHTFFHYAEDSVEGIAFAGHFEIMRQRGAIFVDNIELANVKSMLSKTENGEVVLLLADFKLSLNAYLRNLVSSPVRSLQDIIDFNINHTKEEKMEEFGQEIFLASERTNGIGVDEQNATSRLDQLCKEGIEKLMKEKSLDAVVFPEASASTIMAICGCPAISVPAGYSTSGVPFGLSFGGLKGSDQKLVEIAFAFEQATKARQPPTLTA